MMPEQKFVFPIRDAIRYRFPTHINDLVMDRAEAETSEAFVVVIEVGHATPVHIHHDTEQIYYVLEGEGRLQVGDQDPVYDHIEPGDLVRVPAHTFHSVRCEGDKDLVYLAIDCFMGGRPASEPTWESHVKGLCANNGWDFSKVRENKNA